MNCAIYARVSSKTGGDPEVQLIRLRAEAKHHDQTVYDEYYDRASGSNPARPDLLRMLADARGNRFSTIYIVRLDRIMRSTKHLLELLEELDRSNTELVCLDQEIDFKSPMGRMMITMLGAIAEYEREIIRERVVDGLAKARANGVVLGRKPVDLDMEEALALYSRGLSWPDMAERLGVSVSTLKRRFKDTPHKLHSSKAVI